MLTRQPAEIGMAVEAVDTPALLLDIDILDRNLKQMADTADQAGVRLRPHAKSHKCPNIALKQMALGAVGVCCQKVSEAEAMVEGGIRNVLVTYEIVGEPKVLRLASLARHAQVSVITDHLDQVMAYSRAASELGVTLSVMVDVYVGGPRTGVEPGGQILDLAQQIAVAPGLKFGGLQAYNGAAQHIRDCTGRAAEGGSNITAGVTALTVFAYRQARPCGQMCPSPQTSHRQAVFARHVPHAGLHRRYYRRLLFCRRQRCGSICRNRCSGSAEHLRIEGQR